MTTASTVTRKIKARLRCANLAHLPVRTRPLADGCWQTIVFLCGDTTHQDVLSALPGWSFTKVLEAPDFLSLTSPPHGSPDTPVTGRSSKYTRAEDHGSYRVEIAHMAKNCYRVSLRNAHTGGLLDQRKDVAPERIGSTRDLLLTAARHGVSSWVYRPCTSSCEVCDSQA